MRRTVIRRALGFVLFQVAFHCIFSNPNLVAAQGIVAWGANEYGQRDIPPDLTNAVALAGGELHSLALLRDGRIVGWGAGTNTTGTFPQYGQANPPADLTNVIAIAAHGEHSLALRPNGMVVAWGWNHYGQGAVPPELSNVVAIAAGLTHNLALRADGTVFAWGYNDYGQRDVPSDLSNVVAVAAGYKHSVALIGDGRVVAWGGSCCEPALSQVPPGLENVVAIAAGDTHSLALKADGTVAAWGGSWNPAATVPAGLTNVIAIAAGVQHSLALRADGTVAVWGNNYYQQTNAPSPLTGVAAIGCGYNHSLALIGAVPAAISIQPIGRSAFSGRTVHFYALAAGEPPLHYQWRFNGAPITGATNPVLTLAEAGLGNAGEYSLEVSNTLGVATSQPAHLTIMGSAPLVAIQPENQKVLVGQPTQFSVLADGSGPLRYQWRYEGVVLSGATNNVLNLGPAQTAQAGHYSVTVSNDFGGVESAEVLLEVSQVVMWGDYYTPPVSGLTNVVAVAAGWGHDLALNADGTVTAWGGDYYGPTNVPSGLGNVIAIAAGTFHSLALRVDGTVAAWGAGTNNTGDPNFGQCVVPAGLSNVVAISAGGYVSLALKADGTVAAWGDNAFGQTQVPAAATNVIAIHTFGGHCLALRGDHQVVAWGKNDYGQTSVPAGLRNVVAVAANGVFSLALKTDGTLTGWGCEGAWSDMVIPASATNVVTISGGGSPHYLALKQDGTAVAWGYEEFGAERVPAGLPPLAQAVAGGFYNLAFVGDTAPFLVAPPLGRKALAGGEVTISAQATGVRPMTYQWFFNGVAIPSATSAWLLRSAVTTNDSGAYTLMVSNALGTVTSAPAMLEVIPLDAAPLILAQPEDQLGWPGSFAEFRVQAGGAQPLNFQWQFNGHDLPDATNAILHLTDLSVADIGYYRVRITNHLGEAISDPAFLAVLDYGAALNATGLVWLTGISDQWVVDTSVTHDGVLAARAAGRRGHPASQLQTTVTGPGLLTFWWKANPSGSSLGFVVEGQPMADYYSGGDWQQRAITIPAGEHTLRWWCESDGWLDQVVYVQGTNLPPIIAIPPQTKAACHEGRVRFAVEAAGTPPLQYQWQFNSTNLPGATNQTLELFPVLPDQAGQYSVIVINGYGAVTSAVAPLLVLPLAHWGLTTEPMNSFPLSLTNAVALAAGGMHSLALKADGTVVAWGENDNMQTQVPPGLSNVVAVAGGGSFSMALQADGQIVAWGHSYVTNIPPDLTNAVAIAAGGMHALALKADGTVVGWGYYSPDQTRVPPYLSNVVALAASYHHNLALKADGTVEVWGDPSFALSAPPDLTNAIAVVAGYGHSLALRADGTVTAWGDNSAGQTDVPLDLTNVVAIAAGYSSSLALCADGRVVGWGNNADGQLNGPCGSPPARSLAAGWFHGTALLGIASASPPLVPLTRVGNTFRLALPTERGKHYRLEHKSSLSDPRWTMQPPIAGDGAPKILTDPAALDAQRYYRVYRQP